MERRKSKRVKIGDIYIGGNEKIAVQSMTNTDSADFDATYHQIKRLENVGCDIVRMTVPDIDAVKTVYKLKNSDIKIPIVADIHFDYKMAIEAANAGADKIRINPGNIGDESRVKAVVDVCFDKNIPIRIGVNSGSLEKNILAKYGRPSGEALAESALYHASLLEKFDFYNIILAVKSSRVADMIQANRILAEKTQYPLHLGVTEAGTVHKGVIKSAVGIGSLLLDGIGDTMRVSLTADPVEEIREGKAILSSIGISEDNGINIISCPTCGRTKIDLIGIANEFERRICDIKVNKKVDVAIMGCVVNGPGEAKECDIGIAGGIGEAVLFKKGEVIRKIDENRIIDELIEEIKRM
ncbi:MAG: flavodoxin-dependent (E)-4-hydroxy-3-methylbut-2-enyl-diphosphate synthase [Ruminococcaceae bacterium]|nr:flavodoxin-dependent (E)-4-hydroxy-3-methylbut-2-enyl-diphosphate synthase [Oscillospiraceae bacterium]